MDFLSPQLPRTSLEAMPLFPLPSTVLFPGTRLPLNVFEPRYRDLVEYALSEGQGALAVPLLQPGYEADYEGRPPVHSIMGAGIVLEHERQPDGRYHILIHGTDRLRLIEELPPERSFRLARVERLADEPALAIDEPRLACLRSLALQLAQEVPEARPALSELLENRQAGTCLAGELAARLIPDPAVRQRLLEERDPLRRIDGIQAGIAEIFLRLTGSGAPDSDLN
ncbi:MAG: LON peptidase substrate-binding domain-containing protein [Deltaproteobacteria bacterium]|nr:LON peptidase substrate-binding domain-containing protein [Deltaproteobacteria bacterium]